MNLTQVLLSQAYKPTTLIILFLSFAINCFSQVNETNSPNDSYKKLLTPPSPNAASLFKFEDIPVSNHTGSPSVNIPLATVKTLKTDSSTTVWGR